MEEQTARVIFETDRCKGCGLCVMACPKKIVHINGDVVNAIGYNPAEVTDMSQCIGCAMCATMCPYCVIEVRR